MSSPPSSQPQFLQTDLNRVAALAWGVVCWKWATRLWERGDMTLDSLSMWLGMFGPLLGLALFVCAMSTLNSRRASWLSLVGAGYALLTFVVIQHRGQLESGLFFSTDAHIFMDYAARLLRHGENPYDASLLDAFRAFRTPLMQQTPLLDGDLTGRVAYPALSFLLLVPFEACGIATRYVYALFMIGGLILVFARVKPSIRALALLPFFIDDSYLNYSFGGVTDSVWAVLLMGVVVTWNSSPWWRALLLGLACSYKQQPWLVAPLLAMRVAFETDGPWKDRARAVAQLGLVALLPFVIFNAPFFFWNPTSFLNGVLEPWRADMIMFGQGLSAFTMMGRIVIDKRAYTAFFFGAYVLCAWIYARHFDRMRALPWIVPPIAFWFAPRSLSTYWYLNALPFALELLNRNARTYAPRLNAPRVRSTLFAVGGFLAFVIGTTLFFASRPPPFSIALVGPHDAWWESVRRLRVVVENHREKPLDPQFYVHNHVHQPVLWRVVKGPESVAAGARATFDIEAPWPIAEPITARGAVVTVAQHNSYDLRASAMLRPHVDSRYPDAIPHGDFRYWSDDGRAPLLWTIMNENAFGATARPIPRDRANVVGELEVALPKGSPNTKPNLKRTAELDTYLLLPEAPVEVTMFVPETANRLPDPDLIYGLRLYVGGALHLVLFGEHAGVGQLADGTRFFGVKSARGRWTRHVLDLRAILTALDAELQPRRMRMPRFEMLDMPMIPVGVRLSVTTKEAKPLQVRFGRIRTLGLKPDLDSMVEHHLAHPEELALWHAQYRSEHGLGADNLSEAIDRAVSDPSATNQFIAGKVALYEKSYVAALTAYTAAQRGGYDRWLTGIGIGHSLLGLHQYKTAHEAFQRVATEIENDPKRHPAVRLAEAYQGMAAAAAEQGDCKRARAMTTKAHQLVVTSTPPVSLRLMSCTMSEESTDDEVAEESESSILDP